VLLTDKKILVTGADGFIGSHLVEHLAAQGHDVRAFVLYNSLGSRGWLDSAQLPRGVEFFAGDIRDPQSVRAAMQGCQVVLHLAALISIPYSYQAPDSYLDTNVRGTMNVLQAARDLQVERVVHTSTSEVYGTARFVPITEEHPLQGQSPYSASKIAADQMATAYFSSFGVPVAVMRPFNTYGPRQSARAVIPTVISQIAAGARTLRLGALHPTRDFNFVGDTVRAFVATAQADKAVGEVINIGSNFEISIGDTARLIAEVMGVRVSVELDEGRLRPQASEVERLWADNAKAGRLLGWEPEYGGREGLRRGLEKTVAWFKDERNLRLYRPAEYSI
jgi:NAD dependent epimerase/dehydratase